MTPTIRHRRDAIHHEIVRVLHLSAPPGTEDLGTDQFVSGFVDLAVEASEGDTRARDEYLALIVPSVRASGISLDVSMSGMVALAMGGAVMLEGDQRTWWYRFCTDYTARMANLWEATTP